MRRGPVIGNLFSITSSYLLIKSVTKFLNKRLPQIDRHPWWEKEGDITEANVASLLQTSLSSSYTVPTSSLFVNKDIENTVSYKNTNIDDELHQLNSIGSHHFISIFETWNEWVDKGFNTFLLYFVILFCLLYLPLHDLYEYKMMKRRRNYLYNNNGKDILRTTDYLNDDLINSKNHSTFMLKENENLDSNTVKYSVENVVLEVQNKSDTIETGIEYKKQEESKQYKDGVTITENLSNYTATSSLASGSELVDSPKYDHVSLNSPYRSDQLNQTSQSSTISSASSFIQFSPSRSAHLNAQVDTRNAYSQPFRFK